MRYNERKKLSYTMKCFQGDYLVRNPEREAPGLAKGLRKRKFCLVGFSTEEQQRYGLQERLDATLI